MSGYDYESKVVSIPDYPEPGVIFKDITPLFSDAEAFQALVKDIADHFRDTGITKVVGAEARGFMLGAPVALELGAGFVPARTSLATARLVERSGATVAGFGFILELAFLKPREALAEKYPSVDFYSLVQVA